MAKLLMCEQVSWQQQQHLWALCPLGATPCWSRALHSQILRAAFSIFDTRWLQKIGLWFKFTHTRTHTDRHTLSLILPPVFYWICWEADVTHLGIACNSLFCSDVPLTFLLHLYSLSHSVALDFVLITRLVLISLFPVCTLTPSF